MKSSPANRRGSNVFIEPLKKDRIGLTFDYNADLVSKLRLLANRKWNPGQKRWEVHLAHLNEIRNIFGLSESDFPPEIIERFKAQWENARLKLSFDTLHGQFSGAGLPGDVLEEIDFETSFPLPGYKFSPKFKSGQWDGKRHLFDRKSMKFPAGLWPRIRQILDRRGVVYDLLAAPEVTRGAEACSARISCATPLRPYQTKALQDALNAGRGILQIATGGGKTLLAAHLVAHFNLPTFFFVHTKDLLHQTAAVFEKEFGTPIGRLGDGRAEIETINVATIQTAARILGITVGRESSSADSEEEGEGKESPTRVKDKAKVAAAIEDAGLVIFDECHHVPADTFYKIAFQTPKAHHRYGLSATPWRDDGHDLLLEAALGPKICAVTCSDLIALNFLVPPKIIMERAPTERFNWRGLAYADFYKRAIVENLSRNRVIAAQARRWAEEGRSILILVSQVEHGRRLLELLPEGQFAYGNLDSDTRRRLLDDLERKLHPILIATTLADEGIDIPELECLILAGGGKSDTKAYQRIGRALRKAGKKTIAYVMDFLDTVPYLDEHSAARLKLYRQEPAFQIETRGFRA
ncbi:DEAD/DEAH box helicase [Candidatus Sumerlaeota bacterium]|nr:DEAD/DEAH box helicase [Candidatus Sumerlaeota bacterium]